MYPHEVKRIAYLIDPECWVSYSGKPVYFKRAMEERRKASLKQAEITFNRRRRMKRKSLDALIKEQENAKHEAELNKRAIAAANSITRKIVSRQEWINNRNQQIAELMDLRAKLEKAYQTGSINDIKIITEKLTSYSEAHNIDKLIEDYAYLEVQSLRIYPDGSFDGNFVERK